MVEKKITEAREVTQEIEIPMGSIKLPGTLTLPPDPMGVVLFAHGSGSSRHSPRNQLVAKFLQENGMATLLFDLLTSREEEADAVTLEMRFNIPLLAERLMTAAEWAEKYPKTHNLPLAFFGASTGAAAALIAAAELGPKVSAVVSRGGRPDLAGHALNRVQCPTLLIVGGNDFGVIELNQGAFDLLQCKKKLEIIPNATHLFDEPGTLEEVGRMAAIWFSDYL